MVQRDRLDAQRYLAGGRRIRFRQIGDLKFAVVDQLQSAHGKIPRPEGVFLVLKLSETA
ncbi:hypothetical protein U8P76_14445 [Rhizobium johnstonii]|nr:hypothetical protein U8P76_14445 [Rhizobium johnstonii]